MGSTLSGPCIIEKYHFSDPVYGNSYIRDGAGKGAKNGCGYAATISAATAAAPHVRREAKPTDVGADD
jgi:hypothetical protein